MPTPMPMPSFKGQQAIVSLRQRNFNSDALKELVSGGTQLQQVFENDVYYKVCTVHYLQVW